MKKMTNVVRVFEIFKKNEFSFAFWVVVWFFNNRSSRRGRRGELERR